MTVRRLKTYTAQTGYVYEYYFVGKRNAPADDAFAPSAEYVFDVSNDRKTIFAVSIFLPPHALGRFSADRGRELSDPEQYAAVKLRLQQAFDEVTNMPLDGRRLFLDADSLAGLLASIGID